MRYYPSLTELEKVNLGSRSKYHLNNTYLTVSNLAPCENLTQSFELRK